MAATFFAKSLIAQQSEVTAVEGDSWLNHLHRSFEETAMGKTWRLGPASLAPETPEAESKVPSKGSSSNAMILLHGADLYRLNCQGCHGESGLGAPPEIASIINPVRSTSVVLIMQRMKSVGADITRAQAAELAKQSKASLLQRLHNGGQDMPSFSYLNDAEVRALLAYLDLLADVPKAASRHVAIRESHARVGELIVKSTCHTCHAASGSNPGPAELAAGAIPPLATLRARVTRAGLVRKITEGAPITLGETADTVRGRMPVFFYLHESEAADVDEYLRAYPPSDVTSQQPATSVDDAAGTAIRAASFIRPTAGRPNSQTPQPIKTDSAVRTWSWILSFVVCGVLGTAAAFTLRELRRLSADAQRRRSLRARPLTTVATTMPSPLWPEGAELRDALSVPLPPPSFMGNPEIRL